MDWNLFCVDSKPYCIWDKDIKERNMTFLNGLDHTYFEYIAHVHCEHLEDEEKQQRAALAIRITYHHGLETLFALLCASLQAPDCIYAWIQKYQSSDIKELLQKINTRQPDIIHKHREQQVSWDMLSEYIHKYSNNDRERVQETIQLFSRLWQRFANDYLQKVHRDEYNQIKHGLRTRMGGFGLAVGQEEEYGVPAPEENMQMLTYSQFGTSFFAQDKIDNAPKCHFTTRSYAINWNPEALVYALVLISMSINNIISSVKILNGIQPHEVRFIRPQESIFFDKPWEQTPPGTTSVHFGCKLTDKQIHCFSKEEILTRLAKAREQSNNNRTTD